MGKRCKFWTINFLNFPSVIAFRVWYRSILLVTVANLAAISLERMHATFRPFKNRIIKRKLFGAAVAAVWITSGLCSAIGVLDVIHSVTIGDLDRGFFTLYLSFFLFFLLIPLFSYTSIAIKIFRGNQPQHRGATSRETKMTKNTFHYDGCILTANVAIYSFRNKFCSCITHFKSRFKGNIFSVASFFEFVMFCKLSSQSSSLYA